MEISEPRISKKTVFLPLYDEDGNPTEILFGLRTIYEGGDWDVYNLFQNISLALVPVGLSSKCVWQMAHGKGRRKNISREHYNFLKDHFFLLTSLV